MGHFRVHFVNRYFSPDISATSQTLSGIAFDLAAAGHDIQVVTSRQLYDDPNANLPAAETKDGVEIHRLATSCRGRDRLAGRAVDYVSFHKAAAVHLSRHVRAGDIIVAKTDPPLISIVAAIAARARGALLVNWLQDIFPEVAQVAGVGGAPAAAGFAALRSLRNWSLRHAQMNVAIGERMRDHLVAEGVPRARITMIPNWADPALVWPMVSSPMRRQWGLDDKLVVGYAGNLGRVHDLSTLLAAIDIIDKKGDLSCRDIAFLFVGAGALHGQLLQETRARALRNVHVHPYQSQERLAETLAIADLHLVSLRPEHEGLVLPSKIYGVMAAARPTIFVGAADGDVAALLRKHDCGVTTPVGDGEALASAVLQLAADKPRRMRMGAAARSVFEQQFTRQVAVRRWEALLSGLVSPAALHRAGTRDRRPAAQSGETARLQ